jgi:predicted ribosome quality control (RQC) complex YloA/Tae2 family protein
MNRRELAHVVEALSAHVGAQLHTVHQPSRDRVLLHLEPGGVLLLMVPRGPFARLTRARGRPRNPGKPFSFQGACRAHLGGPLLSVEQVGEERAVDLVFPHARLHLRLTGRSGGLWLVRGDEVVAAYDGPAPAALPPLPDRPPRDDAPRFAPDDDQSWAQAADKFFALAERARRLADRRSTMERRIRKAIDRTRRLVRNLEADLERASEAPGLRKRADLLASVLHTVSQGQPSFTVDDWDTGEQVTIALDPARSPVEVMEGWYHKARRLDRVGDQVLERLDEAERLLVELADALEQVDDADGEQLDALDRLLPSPQRQRRSGERTADLITWTGPQDQRILVGRNAKANRRLTFQLAKGHDWWLHLREKPGPHVVIPSARERPPQLELLLAAAQIVLVSSKVPVGASADVQYARVKDVRPIPGEVARVRIAQERVLHVTREPSALAGWSSSADAEVTRTSAPGSRRGGS